MPKHFVTATNPNREKALDVGKRAGCSCAPGAFGGSGSTVSDNLVTLFSSEQLAERVTVLGAEISEAYTNQKLVLVCVLKGSFVFTADLARAIDERVNLRIEFLGVQSYGEGTESTGVVQITQDLTKSIEDEHVLIVEDIVDTGLTISHLLELFKTRKPASVKVCSLLHKPARTRIDVPIDYLGFTIEDHFVVGYGLDWAQRYRNLPFIGVVDNE
ncbi:MAG: hypoxanthine phosphoribosyltransferase [Polyangiaceae bacterium]